MIWMLIYIHFDLYFVFWKNFLSILKDNRIWYEVYRLFNGKLSSRWSTQPLGLADWPFPWKTLLRDQLKFTQLWKPPQPLENHQVGFPPTSFDTLALRFSNGPDDMLLAYKSAVFDIPDPNAEVGTLAILAERRKYRVDQEATLYYAIHMLEIPTWKPVWNEIILTENQEAGQEPVGMGLDHVRFFRLLLVDHCRRLYVLCESESDDECILWIRGFGKPKSSVQYPPFRFTSCPSSEYFSHLASYPFQDVIH
jgi:hypothetical protein